MLSDKPGLARSYGSLTRMYFEKEPASTKIIESCNNWLTLNKELNDVFGIIMSKNYMGKIYFNLHKLNNSNKNNLDKNNKEFARGLSSFTSDEISKIKGEHSNKISNLLGYVTKSEVIHKDDMVKI